MAAFTSIDDFIDAFKKEQAECFLIVAEKAPAHGLDCWQSLGERGIFVEINQKFHRIKKAIWDEDCKFLHHIANESLKDSLRDLANYCVMMAIYLDRKEQG